jgi:hypothetical protein
MAKTKSTKRRRTQSELANAMYKTKPPSKDMARDVQLQSRARGSTSPLGGVAVLANPMLGAAAALASKARRK